MDYTLIETAVHDTLKADSWLGNAANVKTWDKGSRLFSLAEKEPLLYFELNDLTAVSVLIKPETNVQAVSTTNELDEKVDVEAHAVTYVADNDADAGEAAHRTLIKNIESVANVQRSSANAWGIEGYTANVRTELRIAKSGDYFIFLSITTIKVSVINTI